MGSVYLDPRMFGPRIAIVGAGLAGLTLGRSLKAKGITAIVLERASSSPRFNYSITLHRWAYQPLLKVLQLDESAFSEKLAVDAYQGGNGDVRDDSLLSGADKASGTFRCHRGKLELLLREGQDIRWEQTIEDVEIYPGWITIRVQNGPSVETDYLVAGDGVHSRVRKALKRNTEPKVLPYVVFSGRRTMALIDYEANIALHMRDSTRIHSRHCDVVLQVSVNDITPTQVDLSYTYSRPAQTNDLLHKPDRPLNEAENISDAFYSEIEKLEGLQPPFVEIFHGDKVRQDRILHWLMRTIICQLETLQDLANHNVLLIGDAAHAMPILGGEGANMAIKDGIDVAERFAQGLTGLTDLSVFIEQRHQMWKQAVEKSEERLADMHVAVQASL